MRQTKCMVDTNKCECGRIATALVEYEDGVVEPVCEFCLIAKREWSKKEK